jgi:hypothetical protein
MGTLWHLWSPVLISLAALFSKGEDAAATPAPGLTLLGVRRLWECVCVMGARERGRGCVCRRRAEPRSSAVPWPQVIPLEDLGRMSWSGGCEGARETGLWTLAARARCQ